MKASVLVSILVVVMGLEPTTKLVTARSTRVEERWKDARVLDESKVSLNKRLSCKCGICELGGGGPEVCCPCGCECGYTHNSKSIHCHPCDCDCGVCGGAGGGLKSSGVHCCQESCGCFPGAATVSLENGNSVTMFDLKIGDKVQTVSPNGKIKYSEVRTFLNKDPIGITTYKSLSTSSNNTIRVTKNHLIYARRSSTVKFNHVYVHDVSIGDEVLIQNKDGLVPTKIISMSKNQMKGVFVPVTMEGNIMADGVLASCYASLNHDLAQIIMTPMKWYPEILDWVFGLNNGAPHYSDITKYLGHWLLPSKLLYK